ncbi:MAG TPA: hypothetical protein VF081_13550 [Solirubrobacterales bacterium]
MTRHAQSHPTLDDARELLEWQPPLGVLSVYVRIDPADRGGGWRTALRNGLADALVRAKPAEHDARVALRSTADRIARRFGDQELQSLPRGSDVDLIAEPAGRFLELVETAVERRDAELERRLVERALEETRGGAHGVAGAQEAAAALEEGRVDHLIVDDATEPLIRRALRTGARITPVSGAAAENLAPAEGVAALLRY